MNRKEAFRGMLAVAWVCFSNSKPFFYSLRGGCPHCASYPGLEGHGLTVFAWVRTRNVSLRSTLHDLRSSESKHRFGRFDDDVVAQRLESFNHRGADFRFDGDGASTNDAPAWRIDGG